MDTVASDLKSILGRLAVLLSDKGMIENCDKFHFSNDFIYVFNGQTFILARFESGITGSVDGELFHKLIDKMGTSKISIEATDTEVVVTKGRAVARFALDKADECPIDLNIDTWKEAPENFVSGLMTASLTCGNDRTDFRTMVIHAFEGIIESSDSLRITQFKLSSPMEDELFIPSDIVKFLNRAKITRYSKSESWIYFENQTGDIICHRIAVFGEKYPDLTALLEANSDGKKITFPERMYEAAETAGIFQDDVKNDPDKRITVVCKAKTMRISSKGSAGSYTVPLPVDFDDVIRFSIQPAFLLQAMEKGNDIFLNANCLKVVTSDYVYLTSLSSEE